MSIERGGAAIAAPAAGPKIEARGMSSMGRAYKFGGSVSRGGETSHAMPAMRAMPHHEIGGGLRRIDARPHSNTGATTKVERIATERKPEAVHAKPMGSAKEIFAATRPLEVKAPFAGDRQVPKTIFSAEKKPVVQNSQKRESRFGKNEYHTKEAATNKANRVQKEKAEPQPIAFDTPPVQVQGEQKREGSRRGHRYHGPRRAEMARRNYETKPKNSGEKPKEQVPQRTVEHAMPKFQTKPERQNTFSQAAERPVVKAKPAIAAKDAVRLQEVRQQLSAFRVDRAPRILPQIAQEARPAAPKVDAAAAVKPKPEAARISAVRSELQQLKAKQAVSLGLAEARQVTPQVAKTPELRSVAMTKKETSGITKALAGVKLSPKEIVASAKTFAKGKEATKVLDLAKKAGLRAEKAKTFVEQAITRAVEKKGVGAYAKKPQEALKAVMQRFKRQEKVAPLATETRLETAKQEQVVVKTPTPVTEQQAKTIAKEVTGQDVKEASSSQTVANATIEQSTPQTIESQVVGDTRKTERVEEEEKEKRVIVPVHDMPTLATRETVIANVIKDAPVIDGTYIAGAVPQEAPLKSEPLKGVRQADGSLTQVLEHLEEEITPQDTKETALQKGQKANARSMPIAYAEVGSKASAGQEQVVFSGKQYSPKFSQNIQAAY